MYIIAVDDEIQALEALRQTIKKAAGDCEAAGFVNPLKALEYAGNNQIDVAFLDIHMDELDGLTLAGRLIGLHPRINIIFVTKHPEYMQNAFSLHASGYILKPAQVEAVREELENLRHPVGRQKKRIRVQTFGNFEIFVDGVPVHFPRSKSKEILAYLIDRKGAGVTKKELAAVLWSDGPYTRSRQNYLYILIAEMMTALKKAGADHIIISKRNQYAVCPSEMECDYYEYLEKNMRGEMGGGQ